MSPPIASVPLMPIDDWDMALGAPVHIDERFCLCMRYEAQGGEPESQGAPWLIQAPPTSMVPETVIPYQLSWQSDSAKSARPVHALGADAGALGAAGSAAHPSDPLARASAARIVAARLPGLVMARSSWNEHWKTRLQRTEVATLSRFAAVSHRPPSAEGHPRRDSPT